MKMKPFDIAVAVMFAAITFAVAFLSRSLDLADKATEIAGGYGFHLIAAMCVFLVVCISVAGGTAIRQSLAARGSRGMRITAAERKNFAAKIRAHISGRSEDLTSAGLPLTSLSCFFALTAGCSFRCLSLKAFFPFLSVSFPLSFLFIRFIAWSLFRNRGSRSRKRSF